MAKVTTLNSDKNSDDNTPLQLVRLNNTERTQVQVRTLLEIASSCENVIVVVPVVGAAVEIPGEAKYSALDTYLAAQHRLRDLLDDQERWSLEDEKDSQAEDLVEGNLKIQDAQMAAIKSSQRPHRRLNCQLKLFNAGWIAWTGGDAPTNDTLHGIGKSPEEALDVFDRNYSARVPPDISTEAAEPPTK